MTPIAARAVAYGMPGVQVDGNDPLALYPVLSAAVGRARAGEGPTLVEAMTFRYFGHVLGDNDAYMDAGEKAAAMAKDPVPLFRAWLVGEGKASEAELAEIEAQIEAQIDRAQQFAFDSPFPDTAELETDIVGERAA
jgi:pyruvate dehydrogenase E1 component alpha subunit